MRRFLILSLLLLSGCLLPTATDASGGSLTLTRDGDVVTARVSAGSTDARRPVLYLGGYDLTSSETECRQQGNGLACAIGVPRRAADENRSCWEVPCDLPAGRTYSVRASGVGVSANITLYRPDGSQSFLRYQ